MQGRTASTTTTCLLGLHFKPFRPLAYIAFALVAPISNGAFVPRDVHTHTSAQLLALHWGETSGRIPLQRFFQCFRFSRLLRLRQALCFSISAKPLASAALQRQQMYTKYRSRVKSLLSFSLSA